MTSVQAGIAVSGVTSTLQLEVYNISGELLSSSSVDSDRIVATDLTSGTYFVKASNAQGVSELTRLVVNN